MSAKKRKPKIKYASSVKKSCLRKQAWDDGFRYGFNCYKPIHHYRDYRLQNEFNNGFYAGLNNN